MESRATKPAVASLDYTAAHRSGRALPDDMQLAIRSSFSLWIGEALSPLAFGLTWLYLIFGVAHLFTLPAALRWIMSLTAFGTAATMLTLHILWRRQPATGEWTHAGAALLTGLVGLNSALHLFLTGDVLQSSNLLLLVVGLGFFFLSSAWFVAMLLAIYLCWAMAILTLVAPSAVWIHFTFGLLSASVLATTAHLARKRTLRRVTLLRLQDAQRAQQLHITLTAEQKIEEALRQSEVRYRSLYAEVEQRVQELHTANIQLAQAARVKNEFLASVSHELRTPLNAILGLTESLQENIYGPLNAPQQDALRNIHHSGRHLLAVITDILDVAKIEAGQFTLDLGPAAVDAVCQASLMLIKQKAEQKKLTVLMQFDTAVKLIEADDRRLKQILVNLLDNAIKFTPPEGTIGIEVRGDAENKIIYFSVWDTGIGIAHQDFPRLFKPFVQLDSSLAREYAGSGLGLVLVYRMVEMQGGSVTVESEVNQGSRFTVALPWRVPTVGVASMTTGKAGVSSSLPAAPLGADPPLALIADDHELVTTGLTQQLLAQGVRAMVVKDGAEAMEKAAALQPALLLLDMQLPPLDDKAMLATLRSNVHLQSIPIIAMSALVWPGSEKPYLAAGASAYIGKPIGAKQLQSLLQQWLPTGVVAT